MYTGSMPDCPECQKALGSFVNTDQLEQKKRWVNGLIVVLILWFVALLSVALWLNHGPKPSAWTVLGFLFAVFTISPALYAWMRRWYDKYKPTRGRITVEPDGTIHVHDGKTRLTMLEDGGPYGMSLFRVFIPIVPYYIECDFVEGARGTIWWLKQNHWTKLESWTVFVDDPFANMRFCNSTEMIGWTRNQVPTLIDRLRFATVWHSMTQFYRHATAGGADMATPRGREVKLEMAISLLYDQVRACNPRPIHGGRLASFLHTIIDGASPHSFCNKDELENAQQFVASLIEQTGHQGIGVSSNDPALTTTA